MLLFDLIFKFAAKLLAVVLLTLASFTTPLSANPMLLVDMQTGEVLFEREAGQPWYPASLTKLTTAMVVFNAIEAGKITLATPVGISALARQAPGGKSGLAQGRAVTMEAALNLLIVKSANDVAIAIAQTVSGSVENFVTEMNTTSAALGMSATRFANPHGLNNANQTTSARDLAILTLAIHNKFPQYSAIFATSMVKLNGQTLETRNNLLTKLAGTRGMKTGYICASGYNIVANVERNGRNLLAVVLGASSERERGEMVGQMIEDFLASGRPGTGRTVTGITNETGLTPTNMRPQLCGNQAASYLAQRNAAFPFGLAGQKSFLIDTITARTYVVNVMARLPAIPRPRPRLDRVSIAGTAKPAPPATQIPGVVDAINVPLPRPRIHR